MVTSSPILSLIFIVVSATLLVGFFYNIIKLFSYRESGLMKAFRLIGIVVPLIGCFIGWIGKSHRQEVLNG